MSSETTAPAELSFRVIPVDWLSEAQKQLQLGENVQAVLEVDLDTKLRFKRGLLVATDQRLLSCMAGETVWRAWDYRAGLEMDHHDHAGVGQLELFDGQGLLASWRFTLGQNLQAIRLVEQFRVHLHSGISGQPALQNEVQYCPHCLAPLEPDQHECPVCTRAIQTPPSRWTLFRLWRFARPYQGQLFWGFVLALLGTAASLVPPYLTMPLMDEVLIPFQNGQKIDPALVGMYLAGLFVSALLAWALTWAKTYILALVSERIGSDLRTTTYDHLLRQSLEYFGGKRTGDLMSRISSETDRICVFLSLHLLDFITDMLMLIMTAIILFSIDPWLALVTLTPMPFILWMIHRVRARLQTGYEKIGRVWGEVTSVLADTIPGIRVVKAFAQ
jgi:ATP-binding cassette, subfamily B, bacterial